MYLLVYVDNITLTGNNAPLITSLIEKIHSAFAIKDLGKLHYILGLEVSYTTDDLSHRQAKYASNILLHAQLHESKPVASPMVSGLNLQCA